MTRLLNAGLAYFGANGKKLFKYCFFAAILVPVNLTVYALLLEYSGWNAPKSNMAATGIMVMPNYFMNRYFVWNKYGKNSLTGEVLPFWVMAFIGFGFSTLAAWFAESEAASRIVLLAVNFFSYGIVWAFRFFVLDRFMFGHDNVELSRIYR